MGLRCLLCVFLVLGILTAIGFRVWSGIKPLDPPTLAEGWWGKGDKSKHSEDVTIRKLKITISDKALQDLQLRLNMTVFPEPLENVNFEYGFRTTYLQQVVKYWKEKYDWRKQEARLNEYSHFKTRIEGIDIHFLHAKPKSLPANMKVIPLLLIHGWPGSIVEFLSILPILTTPQTGSSFVFEVICPSLPGYGFSEASHQPGLGQVETAVIFDKLMQRIGFKNYYVQGGDWGGMVSTVMGSLFPSRIKGIHSNMPACPMSNGLFWLELILGEYLPWFFVDSSEYSKVYPLGEKLSNAFLMELGYAHIQGSKPDTIGMVLANSPAGLAAYILEKFTTWTDPTAISKPDGGLTNKFTLDDLLTNVMVYWLTGSITSSVRYYKEAFSLRQAAHQIERVPVRVPTGIALFPNELIHIPKSLLGFVYYNIVQITEMPRGGHFAAMEEPELLANDIFAFVRKVELSS